MLLAAAGKVALPLELAIFIDFRGEGQELGQIGLVLRQWSFDNNKN
jgi:hypothetical protein